jgi:CheY-like chemotaxis protein
MDDTSTTVLVAERDEPLREFLVAQFVADRFAAQGAQCAQEARVKLANFNPAALVLGELGQPHEQIGLLHAIRAGRDDALPVVALSADASELAELRAFREGCDDYLRKPFSYAVLLARVRAIVRRSRGGAIPRWRIGALEIDRLERTIMVADQPVQCPGWSSSSCPSWRPTPLACTQSRSSSARCGASRPSAHAHGRRPRLPAAQEARHGRRTALGGQGAGRRLPAMRRAVVSEPTAGRGAALG